MANCLFANSNIILVFIALVAAQLGRIIISRAYTEFATRVHILFYIYLMLIAPFMYDYALGYIGDVSNGEGQWTYKSLCPSYAICDQDIV